MIKVTDTEYYIDADKNQFIVGKYDHHANARKQYCLAECTYHTTLTGAIENVFRRLIREYVATNDVTMTEAVEALEGKSKGLHLEPVFRAAEEARHLEAAVKAAVERLSVEGGAK